MKIKMCNLNLLIKNGNNKIDYTAFLMSVTSSSYAGNSDGDGVYFNSSDRIEKGANKINILKHDKEVRNSSFIITHQRISTSGRTPKYTQPFMDDNIVLAHNGVITYTEVNGKSDTFVVFENLTKLFKKKLKNTTSKLSREQKLIKSIKKVFGNENGSWSIAIFDKISEILYYFKSQSTNINVFKSKNMMYLTTSLRNDVFMSLVNKKEPTEYDIEAEHLYKILIKNNKIKFFDTKEKIEAKTYTSTNYGGYSSKRFAGNNTFDNFNNKSNTNSVALRDNVTLLEAEDVLFKKVRNKKYLNRLFIKCKADRNFEQAIQEDYDEEFAEVMRLYSDTYDGEQIRERNKFGEFIEDRFGEYITKYSKVINKKIEKLIEKEDDALKYPTYYKKQDRAKLQKDNLEKTLANSIIPGKIVSKAGRTLHNGFGYDDYDYNSDTFFDRYR